MEGILDTVGHILLVVAHYLWDALRATLTQLFALFGVVLVLGVPTGFVSAAVQRKLIRTIGPRATVYSFCWLGTPVHELSHALFALLFRHKIHEIRLLELEPGTGYLGYVRHGFNPRNPYQVVGNLFIGIAPVLVGAIVVAIAAHFLIGPRLAHAARAAGAVAGSTSPLEVVRGAWHGAVAAAQVLGQWAGRLDAWSDWRTWVFVWFVAAIASNMVLSQEDLQGAAGGARYLVVTLYLFNVVTLWIGDFATRAATWVGALAAPLAPAFVVALVLDLVLLIALSALPLVVVAVVGAVAWRACHAG